MAKTTTLTRRIKDKYIKTVYMRELKAYFITPLGYVFIGASFACSGYYFFTVNLRSGNTDMTGLFASLFTVALFLIPLLTMRLMSEDRRLRTDQILFTAPISRNAVVAGKYLAALTVYAAASSGSLLNALVMSAFAKPDWPVILCNFFGLLLLGMSLTALCMFLSSFTESQFIAAIAGAGASLLLTFIEPLSVWISNPAARFICVAISFNRRYLPYAMGIFEFSNTVFFLSVAALFLGLTMAALEKRRWS